MASKPLERKDRLWALYFSERQTGFKGVSIEKYIFYGSINTRRAELLKRLPTEYIAQLPLNTYGPDLDEAIANHLAVLNIHFDDGVYTEYPRLLSAYLNGKPLASETLDPSLVSGKHYLPLDDILNIERLREVYENFHVDYAQKHTLDDYLIRHFA